MSQRERPRPSLGADAPRANGTAGRRHVRRGYDGDRLRASELRYRRLFETAQDGILLLDADTARITDVNPSLEDLFGYSHEELVGKELWEIGPVRDIQASREAMRHLQREECIRYEDLPLETRTKERKLVELVSNVYLVDGTRVIQCNVRDMTKRKRAEERLRGSIESLAAQVAAMTQRDLDLSRLNEMNELLHACSTLDEAHGVIAGAAKDLFPRHDGFLAILHAADGRIETVARWGDPVATVPGFAVGDCWALRRGQPHEVADAKDGLVCGHFVDPPAAGSLCVPLTVHGATLGLLCLAGRPGGTEGERAKRLLAVTTGESIKLALSNLRLREELREQATLDVVTGLWNRRYLDDMLARELHRALRRRSPLCLAMLDIDRFKEFNDTFGHDSGDSALRELGQVLRTRIRKSDIACRYGGEEFVIVFPDSPLAGARERMEQILAVVRETEVPIGGSTGGRSGGTAVGRITVSAGVAQADADGSLPGHLLRAADEALFAAKRAGRDRVVVQAPRP